MTNMGGASLPPDWKGALNVSYHIGPGFISDFALNKVRLNVHSYNQVTRIYNVIGQIRGAQEPDKDQKKCLIKILRNHKVSTPRS
ncbi:hypothetical protein AMELA_G00085760 [Ameiurus melas]|uniref:Uncharacterized protein n=1 Tax=Ameiurus melas TaxID=219545 RepID=A0A7J6AYI8_AMEME|nr:hypothetical protein AMELA_G00085760 [Ameiurus melas]